MRMILIFGVLLAGCASPERLAARDDATCQGYGAKPGSDVYIACRMKQDEIRTNLYASSRPRVCRSYGATVVCN